ncbi:DUF6898 family protein [Yunchengibacter salinarum]|uniref:DUF6898 family protein n=1 Tax=Yunchengibacter salinarum TaxID=3133399 RepID=UPI0035B5CFBD
MEERGGIIFEFIPRGLYVKVSAICTRTGVEVSIVGDAMASDNTLRTIAARKLERVKAKKAAESPRGRR